MAEQVANLQQILTNTKPTLNQFILYLKQAQNQLLQMNLQKKSIILLSLAKCLYLYSKNWLADLQKLKYDIFYSSFVKAKEKRTRTSTVAKKKIKKVKQEKIDVSEISIYQIMSKIEQINRSEHQIAEVMRTPKKEAVFNEQKNMVTLPPFEAQINQQMTQDIMNMIKSQQKQLHTQLKLCWKPDWLAYQNILALTPNQADGTLKKKRMSRTKLRNEPKLMQIADKKIFLTQGHQRIRDLQLLSTKVKINKEKSEEQAHYFSYLMSKTNPLLKNIQKFLYQIKEKKSQLPELKKQEQYSPLYEFSLNFLGTSNQKKQNSEKKLFVNEQNNASLTQQLQTIIKSKINNQLLTNQFVSLQDFSQKYGINNEIKGELFYQLLQTDYLMRQDSPQTFGDIRIYN